MICSGTEILYANAQLFNRLTVTKNAVYRIHDRSGMARGLMKRDRGPAEKERKCGRVNSAQSTNWAKVINGPARNQDGSEEAEQGALPAVGCSLHEH